MREGVALSRCGVRKYFFEIFDAKSRVWGQFGPENKLIEGQPNECLLLLLSISVILLFSFFLSFTLFSCRFRAVD